MPRHRRPTPLAWLWYACLVGTLAAGLVWAFFVSISPT